MLSQKLISFYTPRSGCLGCWGFFAFSFFPCLPPSEGAASAAGLGSPDCFFSLVGGFEDSFTGCDGSEATISGAFEEGIGTLKGKYRKYNM